MELDLLIEDRALLTRFRAGERAALDAVYRCYVPKVAAFLGRGFVFTSRGRLCRFPGYQQPADLENAVQETFVRAFRDPARRAYDGERPYRTYLFTIARNWIIDQQREIVGLNAIREAYFQQAFHLTPNAEQLLLESELYQLCQAFVGNLKETERRVFHTRFEQRLARLEVGRLCGLSHMQVRTLEKKLRRDFVRHMRKGGYGAPANAAAS